MLLLCDIFVIFDVNVRLLVFVLVKHVCLHQHLEVIYTTGGLNRVLFAV